MTVDKNSFEPRLKTLLLEIVNSDGKSELRRPEDIPSDASFTELAVNSIDLLDFVLAVEKDFDMEILDRIEPEDLPVTIASWSRMIAERVAGS